MKRRNISKDILLSVLFCALVAALTYSSVYAATVTTDKPDYSPGEIVMITGSGWEPGEAVTLFLHEEPIVDPNVDPDSWLEPSPVADLDGNIYAEFIVQPNDVGVTFTLTAAGLSSGLTAQMTFTDKFCNGTNQQPDPTCPGASDCYLGCRNTSSGVCTGAYELQPSGTVCRPSAGVCDLPDSCDGISNDCPDDVKSTAVCRASAGVCDVAESCNGVDNDCPTDAFKDSSVVCRAAANVCDAAEYCPGDDPNCPSDEPAECGLVTSSSLCTFDIDSLADNQFRLILTPDHTTNGTAWKLNASNPGQFYYNILYLGPGNEELAFTLPYPFVTQGAMPIHIYSDVTITTNDGVTCFEPGTGISNSPTLVTLLDYGLNPTFGNETTVTITLPDLPSGLAYINMHLDYGLKGTNNYSKNASNDAIDATTLAVLIPDYQAYQFGDSTSYNDTVQSLNVFKRDPGIGGLVLGSDSDDPISSVKVQIYDSTGSKLLATVYTDDDGWFMWQYKHTGKPTTFVVKLPGFKLSQSVAMKSNGFVLVDFTVPQL
jgi:hypothetical protein